MTGDGVWGQVHDEVAAMTAVKHATYGAPGEPYANFTALADLFDDVTIDEDIPEIGCLWRIGDKLIRSINMIRQGQADVVDEYRDIASLAINAEVLRRERQA